jgi:molecular chaperone GrpE
MGVIPPPPQGVFPAGTANTGQNGTLPEGENAPVTPQTGSQGDQGEELKEQIQKLTDLAARAQADLQNFKQRMDREAEEIRQFASSRVLLKLLPVFEDLYRLKTFLSSRGNSSEKPKTRRAQGEPLSEGLEQLLLKLEVTLASLGLRRLSSQGQPFDPAKHEVLGTAPGEKDVILQVYEEGYALHGRILQPARVQVGDGNAPPPPPPSAGE